MLFLKVLPVLLPLLDVEQLVDDVEIQRPDVTVLEMVGPYYYGYACVSMTQANGLLTIDRASWLNRFRKLLVRWEKKAENYLGLVQLACSIMVYRRIILG